MYPSFPWWFGRLASWVFLRLSCGGGLLSGTVGHLFGHHQFLFCVWGSCCSWAGGERWPILMAFSISAMLHFLGDIFLHYDDGHPHFWPVSYCVFYSPISYWDPRHYGLWWTGFEMVLALGVVFIYGDGKRGFGCGFILVWSWVYFGSCRFCSSPSSLHPMIGMVALNCLSPVNLFSQHAPDQLMRPHNPPESKAKIGPGSHRIG